MICRTSRSRARTIRAETRTRKALFKIDVSKWTYGAHILSVYCRKIALRLLPAYRTFALLYRNKIRRGFRFSQKTNTVHKMAWYLRTTASTCWGGRGKVLRRTKIISSRRVKLTFLDHSCSLYQDDRWTYSPEQQMAHLGSGGKCHTSSIGMFQL